tara:strand:+ start:50 stop:481 length:432 start_codon:yes stop_codon:yes gene_type:complete
MSCVICNVKCEPWLLLKNENIYMDEENKPIGKTIQTCGYSCSNKLDPMLPKGYGKLILNREDFCFWAVPILPKKKEKFEILTFEEIQELDDISKEKYYKQRDNQLMDNSMISELYNELEMEDEMTYNIENYYSTGSESDYDDY